MFLFLKKKAFSIALLLLILSLIPILSSPFASPDNTKHGQEQFRSELSALNSMDKLCEITESSFSKTFNPPFDTVIYTELCSEIIKNRFTHGPLNYNLKENWIATICGKLFWSHLSSIVISDDILKHSYGLCSQQTIVFMDILKRKKIPVRSVGLGVKEGPGHFLCEVFYNGAWHLYDVSKEPTWYNLNNKHFSLDYYLTQKDSFFQIYEGKISRPVFEKLTQTYQYGDPKAQPGSKMILFHRITKITIYLFPIFFVILLFYLQNKKNKPENSERIRSASSSHSEKINEPVKQGT